MPTIPLITQNPLPNLPDPVLDRERRPTVDYGGVMQEMETMVRASEKPLMSPDALSDPYEALGNVGRALAHTGDVIGDVAIKKMEAESVKQVADAEGLLRQTSAGFEKWKTENPDHTKWLPEWERRLGEVKTQILEKTSLHNLAYNQIAPQLTRYANNSTVEVELAATKQAFGQAKGVYLARRNQAIQTLNLAEMRAVSREGQQRGFLSGQDVSDGESLFVARKQEQHRATQREAARTEGENLKKQIDGDPQAYLDWMALNPQPKEGGDKTWNLKKRYAEQRLWEYQAGAIDEITEPPPEGATKFGVEVEQWNNKYLDGEVRKQHAKYVRDRELPVNEKQDPEEYNRLDIEDRLARLDLDPNSRTEQYYELIRDIRSKTKGNTSNELINRVRERFDLPSLDLPERTPAQKMISALGDRYFDPYFPELDWDPRKIETTESTTSVKREPQLQKRRQLLMVRTQWEMAMKSVVDSWPDLLKRPEQLKQAAREALPPSLRAIVARRLGEGAMQPQFQQTGARSMMNRPAPPASQDAALRAMQPGGKTR